MMSGKRVAVTLSLFDLMLLYPTKQSVVDHRELTA